MSARLLIGTFGGRLKIARLGHTDIVQIFATSRTPVGELIANTLIDRYIEHSFRENYSATAKISAWLDEKLERIESQSGEEPGTYSRSSERHWCLRHRPVP